MHPGICFAGNRKCVAGRAFVAPVVEVCAPQAMANIPDPTLVSHRSWNLELLRGWNYFDMVLWARGASVQRCLKRNHMVDGGNLAPPFNFE